MSVQSSVVRAKQRLKPLGILMLGIGAGLYIVRFDLSEFYALDPGITFLVSATFIGYGAAILLFNYLRGENNTNYEAQLLREELNAQTSRMHVEALTRSDLEQVQAEIASLKSIAQGLKTASEVLSEDEKNEIKGTIRTTLLNDVSSSLLKEIEAKYAAPVRALIQLRNAREQLDRSRSRLIKEIEALNRRGNINLIIGVITTVVAVWILAAPVLFPQSELSLESMLSQFAPRLALSLFIEVFSFFFLRLYKAGLSEVKYYQNELTNIESKFVALENALHLESSDAIQAAILSFANTERNIGSTEMSRKCGAIDAASLLSEVKQLTKAIKE